MTFNELNLSAPLLRAIAEAGYETPSPIQAKAIPPVLEGRDLMGCAQTGTGKTCAFAAPILQRLNNKPASGHPIRALILTPTRELAIQICDELRSLLAFYTGIRVTVLYGGASLVTQAKALEKKIKADLLRLQKDDQEKYETFWKAFGTQIKVGVVSDYGAHKELLKDLLLFFSSKEGKLTSLAEYKARMPVEQKYIYYACGEDAGQLAKLPQAERIRDKGYEILYLTDEPDQFVIDALGAVDEVAFKSVDDADALPETDEEKAALEQKAEESKPVLDFLKETLGDAIKEARVSKILKSGAVCLTADGPITLEMEKYFQRVDPENAKSMKAQRVLELNPDSAAFAALSRAVESDRDKAARYAKLLYAQAQLIAGLPLEDPAGYTELVCSLMN